MLVAILSPIVQQHIQSHAASVLASKTRCFCCGMCRRYAQWPNGMGFGIGGQCGERIKGIGYYAHSTENAFTFRLSIVITMAITTKCTSAVITLMTWDSSEIALRFGIPRPMGILGDEAISVTQRLSSSRWSTIYWRLDGGKNGDICSGCRLAMCTQTVGDIASANYFYLRTLCMD